jgi:hypothetical protein
LNLYDSETARLAKFKDRQLETEAKLLSPKPHDDWMVEALAQILITKNIWSDSQLNDEKLKAIRKLVLERKDLLISNTQIMTK